MTSRICFLHVTGLHIGGIITTPSNSLRVISLTTPLRSSSSSSRSCQLDVVFRRSSATPTRTTQHPLSFNTSSFTSTFQSSDPHHHIHHSSLYGTFLSSRRNHHILAQPDTGHSFHSRTHKQPYRTNTTTMSQKEMLSPAQVHAMLTDDNESNTVYVDVRTTSEFDGGHIPQAVNLPVVTFGLTGMSPVESFADDLAVQVNEKGYTKVIVGCKSGRRSTMAIDKLMAKHPEVGTKVSIYELDGGFDNYAGNKELPVEKK